MCIYCEGAREDATEDTAETEPVDDDDVRDGGGMIQTAKRLRQWIALQ